MIQYSIILMGVGIREFHVKVQNRYQGGWQSKEGMLGEEWGKQKGVRDVKDTEGFGLLILV